jgi:hypothetical protein
MYFYLVRRYSLFDFLHFVIHFSQFGYTVWVPPTIVSKQTCIKHELKEYQVASRLLVDEFVTLINYDLCPRYYLIL